MATGNPNYIANTAERIKARTEAAALHMQDQSGLRRGMATASLWAANALDRVGSLFADATAAGLTGGVLGGVMGALIGIFSVVAINIVVGIAVVGAPLIAMFAGLMAITGFASEYNRIKASNPEKKNAARADRWAAGGGALESAGIPPRSRAQQTRRSMDGARQGRDITMARADYERARAQTELIAPGTIQGEDPLYPNPSPTPPLYGSTSATSSPAGEKEYSYVQAENERRGRESQAAADEARSQVERLREREAQATRDQASGFSAAGY